MSSCHEARVVILESLTAHPNADRLEVAQLGEYTTCVAKGEFQCGDRVVFIEPDTVISVAHPSFAFLSDKAKNGKVRIRAMRLRGVSSFGLLLHAPKDLTVGQNAWDFFQLEHYEPPILAMRTDNTSAPWVPHVRYDMESLRKHPFLIPQNKQVMITEKIDGASSRYVWHLGSLHVGNHKSWKKKDPRSLWWKIAIQYELSSRLRSYSDHVFHGEIYGYVKDLRYGAKPGEIFLAIFDIMYHGQWLPPRKVMTICADLRLPHVPILYTGPWQKECVAMADGPSMVKGADHLREGIVVNPLHPQVDAKLGRMIGKVVSVDYLARKGR